MDHGEGQCRLIGDYILGPKIGSGSFAVVWRSRHRYNGCEVAIKEIDRKQLSNKVNDNLLKEITILRQIEHPNIIRFHDAIEVADKIYLVLEYCNGGDLAAYIQRFGRVSEAGARHFMIQLASGLQVLRKNNLIHRDLKPQNLLLSTNDETPVLKIGDFGFARYLNPQGLADTLCGSPLYMAPEIIQNQKYDAKADLWSVGAILFQLVTGKPPFDGNNQFQLFQNVTSNELEFPRGFIRELHPDCVDLCKSLLRRNPVERLTFEEFFNHKFLTEPRLTVEVGYSSPLLKGRTPLEHRGRPADDKILFASDMEPREHLSGSVYSSNICSKSVSCSSVCNENIFTPKKEIDRSTLGNKKLPSETTENVHAEETTGCVDQGLQVVDSLDFIEQEYVLVNAHFASMETLSFSLEASVQDHSTTRLAEHSLKKNDKGVAASMPTGELAISSVSGMESLGSHGSAPLATSQASIESVEVPGLSLHPSARLRLLHQYVHALSELAKEKLDAGLHLESFSVELVALAVWKEALSLCKCWVSSTSEVDFHQSVLGNESSHDHEGARLADGPDFDSPASVCSWFEQGFLVAFDRVERLSSHLRDIDANIEMPDAIELIFQTALVAGKHGAVDELMRNWSNAAASYSKAAVLLSFILAKATSLPLSPPFSLSPSDRQRLHRYIINLQAHQKQSLISQASTEQPEGAPNK